MKKQLNKNRKITLSILCLFGVSFYSGQNIPIIKSPQTYNIEKFGNIPVSMNTGSISYDVNLFNYGDIYNGNGYNIGLRYYGTGFIPAKKSNYVGLDWSLDIGGAITREVRGLPDDFFSDWPKKQGLYGYLEGVKTSNKTSNDIYNQNYNQFPDGGGGIGIKTGAFGFEIEPDKFSFNFMGNSGYFFIGNDMKPIIISDNKNLKIDVSGLSSKQPLDPIQINGSQCLTKPTTITITDEKGIKYYFGGNYENLEISYNLLPNAESENPFTITSWNLFKIEYPNSNILEIKYRTVTPSITDRNFCRSNPGNIRNLQEPFLLMFDHNTIFKQEIKATNGNYNTSSGSLLYDGTIYWGGSTTSSDGSNTSYSATKKSFPDSILLNGKTIVFFDFERFDQYLGYTIPSLKLKNIIFYSTSGNQIVKQINLDYYRYKDYFFLDKVKMYKKDRISSDYLQEYSFDYYNKNTLPDENTALIDYWGYFNNKPRMNMIPNFTLNKNTGDYVITDNTQEADPTLSSIGLMKTITYPTKGKSEFIYEPHKYSEKIDRNSSSQFKNILIQSEGIVSGGRINKIINYSNDGTQIGTKDYKYVSNYSPNGASIKSSGILSNFYRNLTYVRVQTPFSTYEELNAYSDNFIETSMNSFPVLYSEVTEIENNKGYTKYYFTDYKMYPDSQDNKAVDNNTSNLDVNYYPANITNINLPYRSNNYKRGKLYKQEIYDQNFNKLKSSNTEFIDVSEVISNNFATYVTDRLRTKYFFKLFGGSFSPSKTISDDILNNNLLSSKSEYFYQSANGMNISKIKSTNTDGKITETNYQYAHEKGNQKLINTNIVDTPLEISVLEKQNISDAGKLVSKSEVKYDNPANVYPTMALSYDLQNGTPSTEATYDLYDGKGNLQQYTTKDGVSTTIIWGYNNTQPIAKIEGAKLSDIQQSFIDSIVNASDTDALAISNSDEASFLSVLNTFRNNLLNYQISTYTYDPSIGIRSITPPTGIREVYIYDRANRIKEIRQDNATGKILKELKYNYKN
ncbi:hypothetical protein [Chryseobacterium polytrichastri]|uniref:YD repeat-containing protein n=1 Tax=Chryseobacterium polytrichastri TaxID=1302687 RepID=A0A1M6R3I5_9FLAO|nr:hypothetical protein [Chryseobacterium polytrichastri]SHK27002.1 hypothetical protein SAMN05444267_1002171 [Chryseobacterium polytrichastri]